MIVRHPRIFGREEGKLDVVARRADDRVQHFAAAIGEDHAVAVQPGDGRLHRDVAAAHPGQELAAHRRVGVERFVIGRGQPIIFHIAHQALHLAAADPARQRQRQPRRRSLLVGGDTVEIFGQHPHAAPGRDKAFLRDAALAQFRRDIDRAVAQAHHHHPLANQVQRFKRRAIIMGVDDAAVELAVPHWAVRAPVMAVGNHDGAIGLGAMLRRHIPIAIRPARHFRHRRFELHQAPQAEMIDIIVEILGDQTVVREIRPIGGNRKFLELQPPFRRVDVQRLVGAAHAVGVVVGPVAADPVRRFEPVEHHPLVAQTLGGGETGTAGTDQGNRKRAHGNHPRQMWRTRHLTLCRCHRGQSPCRRTRNAVQG